MTGSTSSAPARTEKMRGGRQGRLRATPPAGDDSEVRPSLARHSTQLEQQAADVLIQLSESDDEFAAVRADADN